jgi:nucleoside-diphosphate-sugar epimerase
MRKVLVTGSKGFIAQYTIKELHSEGYQVVGLERHSDTVTDLLDEPDIIYFGDIRDYDIVEKAVASADGVINLAGLLGTAETFNDPEPLVRTNILGALNVMKACEKWSVPLIQIGVGNYWMNNSYSTSKETAVRYVKQFAKKGNNFAVVRAMNAYGAYQKFHEIKKIIPTFINRALDGEAIHVHGGKDNCGRMDMIHVADLATVLVEALQDLTKGLIQPGEVVEAGTGEALSVWDIAEAIVDYVGRGTIEEVEVPLGYEQEEPVVAKEPYPIKYMDFEDGIKDTIRYYKGLYESFDHGV